MKYLSSILTTIPLACKTIYIVSFILYIIGFIISSVPLAIANHPQKVWKEFEVWRLLVTFFSKGESTLSVIAIVADFVMIRFVFTGLELKYSTVFFFFEIFIQNLVFQIFFTLVCSIFIYLNLLTTFLISYGWTPLIVIFVYKYAYKDKDEKFKVVCVEFEKRYLPLVIVVMAFVFAFDQFVCVGLAVVFGYLQFGVYGKGFVALPLGVYKRVESWLPNCVSSRADFKKIEDCEANVIQEIAKSIEPPQPNIEVPETLREQEKKQEVNVSDHKKPKKQRKTAKSKSSSNSNSNKSGSIEFHDQLESGKSTKDGMDMDAVPQSIASQVPNMETNNELNRENNKE